MPVLAPLTLFDEIGVVPPEEEPFSKSEIAYYGKILFQIHPMSLMRETVAIKSNQK